MINDKFCHSCDNQIPTLSKFCRFCGLSQSEIESFDPTIDNGGYFVSHWRILLAVIWPALSHSLIYGVFAAIVFFTIEASAAFFGYCVTFRGQGCSETGDEIIYIPLAAGGFYFIYGALSSVKRFLAAIAQSLEIKKIFGLNQQPIGLLEYLTSRGLHTLFFPKYILLLLSFLLLLISQTDLSVIVMTLGASVIFTDLRFLKWLFIKQLKLDKYAINTK